MINLLKSELYKLFKNRIFIVCSFLLVCIALFALNTMYIEDDLPALNGANILKSRAGDNIPLVLMRFLSFTALIQSIQQAELRLLCQNLEIGNTFT